MKLAQLAGLLPLIIPALGSILSLLLGAAIPGRYIYGLAVLTSLWTLIWMLLPGSVPEPLPGFALNGSRQFFAMFAAAIATASLLLSRRYNRFRGISGEEYPATVLFALTAMVAAAGATDLLVLFLGLEGFTFGFYLLVAVDRRGLQTGEAGVKFLLNGTLAAALMGMGLAILYAATGTLRFAQLAQMGSGSDQALLLIAAVFLMAGVAFKLSLVPVHLWTPDIYQGAPAPVAAFLGGSKVVAFGALLPLILIMLEFETIRQLLWVMAVVSMLAGSLASLRQQHLKRLLGWSVVAQFGTIAIGLVAGGREGVSASIVAAVAYGIAVLAAMGVIATQSGKLERHYLDDWAGVGRSSPLAGGVLALAVLSMAGIPPTIGFMGKFMLFLAAIGSGQYLLAIVGVLSSLISAVYCLKIVALLYMEPEGVWQPRRMGVGETAVLMVCLLLLLLLGLLPGGLIRMAAEIAAQLLPLG